MVHEQEQQDGKKGGILKRMMKLSPPSKSVDKVPKKTDQKDKKRDRKVRYQDNVYDDTEEMTTEQLENSFDKTRRSRLGLGSSSSNLNFDFNASYRSDGRGINDQSLTLVQLCRELELSSD
jgi:hypothetical protein